MVSSATPRSCRSVANPRRNACHPRHSGREESRWYLWTASFCSASSCSASVFAQITQRFKAGGICWRKRLFNRLTETVSHSRPETSLPC